MCSSRRLTRFAYLLSIATLPVSTSALAGDGKGSGTATYVSYHIGDRPVAGGNMLGQDHLKGVMLADGGTGPFHLAVQDCLSSMVAGNNSPPQQINGVCDGIDKDGDVFWMWFHDQGDIHTWAFMGGTGKFDGISGGGTTKELGGAPDRLVISWEGSWKMK